MAKKNENKLSYLQMPLPESRKYYKMIKRTWNGLNYRQTIDTGSLSAEHNISTLEAPYLVPSQKHTSVTAGYAHPISMFGFDDFLLVIYRNGASICIDYILYDSGEQEYTKYTGTLQESGATEDDEYPRCVVQFNVYGTQTDSSDGQSEAQSNVNNIPTDPISGQYTKKLLIFPDKKSMDFEIKEDNFSIDNMTVLIREYSNSVQAEDGTYPPPESASHNYFYKNTYNQDVYQWFDDAGDSSKSGWKVSAPPTMPNIKYAAVHLSRLFGVDDDRVYASGFNNYANWNLDTVDEYNESNAWCSPAQSNTKAGGKFTGITNFQGHIVCFKHDFMHEIYNTKNPFRIQDVYAEGTTDNRTVQDVDGRLIFASDDNVKIYTGSNPRIISYYLNLTEYKNAVSGTDGRCYYLYCEDKSNNKHLFVYDTVSECWAEQYIENQALSFAHNKNGMYMLCDNGYVYKMDTGNYQHSWNFETDLITNETVDIKHIKKIQMFAEIAAGADIKVYILYDDEKFNKNTSHLVYQSTGHGQKAIRVKPRKTASYGIKLHVEGYGYIRLYELELFIENGGDLYA